MDADEIVRAARGLCARSLTGLNKYHGYIATKSSKHGEGVYDAIIERLYRHEHGTVPELCDLIESLQAQLAAERVKYAELQRYNVDCTKACDRQMVEILELRGQSAQLSNARNELCQRCGRYHEAHKGACDGCRWREKTK